jgi:hypothetical protein
MSGDARINSSTTGTQPTFSTSVDETATAQKTESPKQADISRTSGETKSDPPRYMDEDAIRSRLAEFNLGGQLQEMVLRGKDIGSPIALFSGTGGVMANSAAPAGTSKVDDAVARFTGKSFAPDAAAAEWKSLSAQEQRQVASRLIENHPKAAAELAQQLGQAGDPGASKEFWKHAESWMTQTVADTGYHPRLENARAFMDEVAMLGPQGKAAKSSANSMVMNIPFSDEFRALSKRAMSNSVTEASRARAQLHLDTWRMDLSGDMPSLQAMARRDPEAFVRNLDSMRGNKKEYDAAFEAALKQPSVDFTGRGERNGRTTDPYMENLQDAAAKYGSPTLKADLAMRMHEGGSLRPGYEDAKKSRRDMIADPEVLSILLNEKAEPFSRELRDMMKTDPTRAQNVMAAGVSGFTLAYHKAMSKNPPDTQAAKRAAYDLGLLLGEAKEAAKEAFVKNPAEGYNFLENVFKFTSKKLMGLIPGSNLAADVGKEILEQLSDHFIKEATKFKEDVSGKKIEEALDKFVAKMFAATRDSFWTLRDQGKLNESVKQSPKLDAIKNEYKQFNEWLDGGYAAGRDSDNNSSRTR